MCTVEVAMLICGGLAVFLRRNNRAHRGGACFVEDSSVDVFSALISHNVASGDHGGGGGLFLTGSTV